MNRNRLIFAMIAALSLALPLAAERKEIVPAELAPRPGAAAMFTPGILVDGTLYISGQLGTDLKTRQIPDNFDDEVRNALASIGLILKQAGMDYADVVSATVYLSDMDLFGKMNAVYSTVFKEPRPARTTIGVAELASAKAHVEISVIAKK